MFARKRDNESKSRGQLLRGELAESFDHALRAAGHAASGVSDSAVGHTAGRVRDATVRGWGSAKTALAPLSEAAQTRVKDMKVSRKGPDMKRRWPVLAGLLAGGAALGAAGAMLLRRRRKQWEGYEPDDELDLAGEEPGSTVGGEFGPDAALAAEPAADGNQGQAVDAARAGTAGEQR